MGISICRSAGQFVERNAEVVCDPYQTVYVGKRDAPFIGGDRLTPDVKLVRKYILLHIFFCPQPAYIFSDNIFDALIHF